MSDTQMTAKTIKLLLYNGDIHGVISIADSNWNAGELYSAPRASVKELLETEACSKFGVYMLLSRKKIYIGQSSDLAKRINQHLVGKDWWESVIVLTRSDDSLTHTDIDYLEATLIEKAQNLKNVECENKNKGNPIKVSKFQKVELDLYLQEALFLLSFIGVKLFDEKSGKSGTAADIETVPVSTSEQLGKRSKVEAVKYLTGKGISVSKSVSYASLKSGNGEYWLNPRPTLVNEDWDIVLNDTEASELTVCRVPAGTFTAGGAGENALPVRADNGKLDLNINGKTFVDRRSDIGFAAYIVNRVKY